MIDLSPIGEGLILFLLAAYPMTKPDESGLIVEKRHGSFVTTFPPLTIVVAWKPR
jgi:hypothetical protein